MADLWVKKKGHTTEIFKCLSRFTSIIDAAIAVEETIRLLAPRYSLRWYQSNPRFCLKVSSRLDMLVVRSLRGMPWPPRVAPLNTKKHSLHKYACSYSSGHHSYVRLLLAQISLKGNPSRMQPSLETALTYSLQSKLSRGSNITEMEWPVVMGHHTCPPETLLWILNDIHEYIGQSLWHN